MLVYGIIPECGMERFIRDALPGVIRIGRFSFIKIESPCENGTWSGFFDEEGFFIQAKTNNFT